MSAHPEGPASTKPARIDDGEGAENPVTVDSLGFRLHRLVNLINRPFFAGAPASMGLSLHAWRALVVINGHPGASARRIADATGLLPMSVSRALAVLRAEGCVEEKPHPRDRRVALYWLTARGTDVYREFSPFAKARIDEFFSILEPSDLEALSVMIDKLTEQAEWLTSEDKGYKDADDVG